MTLAQIQGMEGSLRKLTNKELKVKIAYRLGKLLKIIGTELSELEENRGRLIRKYGFEVKPNEKDKSAVARGKQYQVNKEKEVDFYREFNELLQEEIEITFEPVSIKELGDVDFTPADIIRLEGIIGVESDAKEIKKIEKKEILEETTEEEISKETTEEEAGKTNKTKETE